MHSQSEINLQKSSYVANNKSPLIKIMESRLRGNEDTRIYYLIISISFWHLNTLAAHFGIKKMKKVTTFWNKTQENMLFLNVNQQQQQQFGIKMIYLKFLKNQFYQ